MPLPYPPLIGLAQLKSFLEIIGHEVFIFDLNIEFFHHVEFTEKEKWASPDKEPLIELAKVIASKYSNLINYYVEEILNTQSKIIGFSIWNSNMFFSLRVAREIKRKVKDRIIIFGGPECFPLYSGKFLIQDEAVDIVVYGEGEETLKEIVSSLDKSEKVKFTEGAIIKKDSRIIDCGPRQPIDNLDALPFPDFNGYPLDKYLTNKLPIFFNRGCPRVCRYCAPNLMLVYRWRSANSIFEEIKCQLERYPNKDGFDSCSPSLNSNLREISALCNLILKDKIDFEWSGFTSIDPSLSLDLLRKMRRAGCFGLNFGIESGSQKIINRMRKGFKIKDAARILQDAHNAGIETTVNFMIGFPGETEEDFQQTLNFISQNWQYISSIGSMSSCWIEPYTYIFDHPEEFDIITGSNEHNWYSRDGKNTPEIRKEREKRFQDFISSIGKVKTFPKIVLT